MANGQVVRIVSGLKYGMALHAQSDPFPIKVVIGFAPDGVVIHFVPYEHSHHFFLPILVEPEAGTCKETTRQSIPIRRMNKTKIIPANFPGRNQPAEGWGFPEESLMRLEILLGDSADLEVGEQRVEEVEK